MTFTPPVHSAPESSANVAWHHNRVLTIHDRTQTSPNRLIQSSQYNAATIAGIEDP